MAEHNLFYYPYASFTDAQLPLLKVAALYFDKLVVLDPVGASWNSVGADAEARKATRLLRDEGILELVTPADVLATYEDAIFDAIRRDMADPAFLALCERHSRATGKQRWTLSLAKVPKQARTDEMMRLLMGDFARATATEAADYLEQRGESPLEYREYAEVGQAYDEYREGNAGAVEYRYADLPLALGEAIMLNHALFGGLVQAGATPIADDPFHSDALSLKLRRAEQDGVVQEVRRKRAASRQLKADLLAASALRDAALDLPILQPELALEDVLECRHANGDALNKARSKLGRMARRIEAEPWTVEFAQELENKAIPDVADALDDARRARDSRLEGRRARVALGAAGLTAGAATAVLAIVTAPLTPIALATAALGLVSSAAIPGGEWLLDWKDGKKATRENGLHYLLSLPRSPTT